MKRVYSTSNIDYIHFVEIVHRIYPAERQLNKANASDTELAFLDLILSIHNDTVSTKVRYMINGMILILILLIFPSLMVMVMHPSYGVYFNLFALSEHLRMLITSIIVTNT